MHILFISQWTVVTVAPSADHIFNLKVIFIHHWDRVAVCLILWMWRKVTKSFLTAFHKVCVVLSHMASMLATFLTEEDDTVPISATADCSTDCIHLLDTRYYCTPRTGHLDFGVGRPSGKQGQGQKRGGGNMKASSSRGVRWASQIKHGFIRRIQTNAATQKKSLKAFFIWLQNRKPR